MSCRRPGQPVLAPATGMDYVVPVWGLGGSSGARPLNDKFSAEQLQIFTVTLDRV